MSNSYYEKKQRKLEAYKKFAENAKKRSIQAYKGAKQILDYIPPGQPILLGHHSEKRHRRDLKRVDSFMGKSVEEDKKAKYYNQKISNLENETKISSDDPEAVEKLKAKLDERLKHQEHMKAENKKRKAEGKARAFATWELQNNNQNINSIKKRIESLEKKQSDTTRIIHEDEKIKIFDNVEENRLQIFYSSIPSEEIRTELKKSGFHWSKYNGCWQRFRSNQAVFLAKSINKIPESSK